jgi:hypothetical protein
MKDAVQDRYERLKRAASILASLLDDPSHSVIRRAESAGCLDEFDLLLEEVRLWLDDDDYYDDLAWNLVNKSTELSGVL